MKSYDVAIIGCGFIVSYLAKTLSKEFDIVTFDVLPQPKYLEGVNIEHKILDIRKFDELQNQLGNPSVVIHTAIIQIPRITEDKNLGYEVNVIGTQNVCKAVEQNSSTKGMILLSSWHTYGEQELKGTLSENIGYRPDKVEDRARLYALSKTLQECLVRFFDEKNTEKIFGVIKIGTTLGEGMPEKTAANIFIQNALSGKKITPFKHSMNRPMLYVAINDICDAAKNYVRLIQSGNKTICNSLDHVINVAYPEPITILDLANIVKDSVNHISKGKIVPKIEIIDQGIPEIGNPDDKNTIRMDISKVKNVLKISELTNPKLVIEDLVKKKISEIE